MCSFCSEPVLRANYLHIQRVRIVPSTLWVRAGDWVRSKWNGDSLNPSGSTRTLRGLRCGLAAGLTLATGSFRDPAVAPHGDPWNPGPSLELKAMAHHLD